MFDDEPFTLRNDQPQVRPPQRQQLTIWCETDGERPAKQAASLEGQQGLFASEAEPD